MLTGTALRLSEPASYLLRGIGGSLALFGVLRLGWIESQVVLPLTRAQGALAAAWLGAPAAPINITLECSGTDALALCLAAVLAYPVPWHRRLAGAAGGAVLIATLNTLRIGTLGKAAASPAWFDALHLYAWPAVLTLAIAGYVFAWMHHADGSRGDAAAPPRPQPSRRFVALTAIFVVVFAAAAPLYLQSATVLSLGVFIAGAAASILGSIGVTAYAASNVLSTSKGAFVVTQECISTPLIPVYLAALCAYAPTRSRLVVGLAAALPLFTALGVARLLVVALPEAVAGSSLFLVHAFYQLLLGVVVIAIAALWRHGRAQAMVPALAGLTAAGLVALLFGLLSPWLIAITGANIPDPQGAIALLPGFQFGLYAGLWVASYVAVGAARIAAGAAVLGLWQAAGFCVLQVFAQSGVTAHVRDIRAWAVVAPLLVFTVLVTRAQPRH